MSARPRPFGVHVRAAGDELRIENERWTRQSVSVAPPPACVWREQCPRRGRLWGDWIRLEPRTPHRFEAVPLHDLSRPVVLGVDGSADGTGRIRTARGVPATVSRARVVCLDGTVRDQLVAFEPDGLLEAVGGVRHEVGTFSDMSFPDGGMVLDTRWPANRWELLDRVTIAVDVPPAVTVRFFLDGIEYPVQPHTHRVELGAAADLPRGEEVRLRVEMHGLLPGDYGGVVLADLPPRSTSEFTGFEVCESDVFERAVDAPGGGLVGRGMSLDGMLVAHRMRPDPQGTEYVPNVAVTPDGGVRASVYRRPSAGIVAAPAVLFIHGGGWSAGDRGFHYRHMHALAERGYVTANVDYRLYPQVGWRDSLADVRATIRWIRANAAELGADPDRVAVVGGSAGAHLAALAALGSGGLGSGGLGSGGLYDDDEAPPAAAALLYPVVDLVTTFGVWGSMVDDLAANYFHGELREASPSAYVHPGAPPVLTVVGDADRMIDLQPVRAFHRALDAVSVRNELVVVPGAGHGFDLYEDGWEGSFDELAGFLASTLR